MIESINNGAVAWKMQIAYNLNVAVGQFEIVHIVDQPELITIPHGAKNCHDVVIWNDNIIPVLNLSDSSPNTHSIIAILAYKNHSQAVEYGALNLLDMPLLTRVNNDQACDLPDTMQNLSNMTISCFLDNDLAIPILDTKSLFSIKVHEIYTIK